MILESVVYPGRALKYKGVEGDFLRAEGYLVVFSGEDDPDLEGEYFTKSTDLGPVSDGLPVTLPAYFHHGLDQTVKSERTGHATVKIDEVGVFAEYWISRRKEYLKELLEAGILGQSSGPVQHLIEKMEGPRGKAVWLKSWPLGEASLTPEPAEPRTYAVPLKSLIAPSTMDSLTQMRESLQVANALRSARQTVWRNTSPLHA